MSCRSATVERDLTTCRGTRAGEVCSAISHEPRSNLNRNDTHTRHSMRITGLATTAYLAVYVSGAAIFRYAAGPPSRKRQGLFPDDFGLADGETTRTAAYPSTTTSTTILFPLIPPDATTATKALFPNLGDLLLPPDGPTTTGFSVPSMVSSTSTSTPTRTHTSSSSTKSAVALSTPSETLAAPSSTRPTVLDVTPTPSPSSTLSPVSSSASSANSTWKTVGVAVSVITLIGLTILLVVFSEKVTAFVRDVFLCRSPRCDQDPLGDEEFLPDKYHENYDTGSRSHNRKWAREIRESARLSNIRYPTDVFYGDGSTLGPGKAGIGAGGGGGRGVGVGEFGQLDRPSRPSFLQRLSVLSTRSPPVSPRLRMKGHFPGIEDTGDGFAAPTPSPSKTSTY